LADLKVGTTRGGPVGRMKIRIDKDRRSLSEAAASHAATSLRAAVERTGKARVVAATGASQLDFLSVLTARPDVPWSRVELFHLDEYIGMPPSHPASFRRYLRERLIDKTGIAMCHLLDGEGDPEEVRRTVGKELSREPVDIMFAGIGENAHLAFNDPPADFDATDPYIIVKLDEACRRQQVGEGWFARVEDVPDTAISISIQQILKAREILVIVPDARKADAVKATLEGEVSPAIPASILRTHNNATLFLDELAASHLAPATRARYAS
jgi:glucosamine-6-phosphate deaminase